MEETRNRLSLTPVLLLTAILACAGCGKEPAGQNAAAKAGGPKPIVVGSFLSLTGPTATFGRTTQQGIALAVQERNAAGGVSGRPVQVLFRDNQGKTQETGTVVERLITADHVVALLGEVASTQSLTAAPIAQQYGVPMISPSSTNPAVTQVGNMIFRTCFIDPDQGYAVARFAYDNLKARKAAVLYDQRQAYSVGLRDAFTGWFKKMGGTITAVEAYSSGDSDYSAQLGRIRDGHPDVIYIPGYYTEVGTIAIQARNLGLKMPLLGSDGWESPKLTEIAGNALDGCYYSNHYAPEDDSPQSKAFVAAYRQAYGTTPGALAALGYDAANLLFDAMTRAQSLDGKDLAQAIAQTRGFVGVTGTITMGPDRNPKNKSMVILEIKNGQPTYVTRIQPPDEK